MSTSLVCRTCLQKNTSETCKNIEDVDNNLNILEMLSYSIPEMNMYLVISPVICDKCICLLQKLFKFKSQCLRIEENLLQFAQSLGQSEVHLTEYCRAKITSFEPKSNLDYQEKAATDEYTTKTVRQKSKKNDLSKINNNNLNETCDKCKGCQLNSNNPSYHLKTNQSPFICYHCNKNIEKMTDLRRHILGHVKQRKCKICDRGFRDLTALKRHIWSHTGTKQFACKLCQKNFQQKHFLDQHMLKHQGNDRMKCSYCQKLFSTKYNAQVHMKTMHKKTEVCDLCGERFVLKQELVQHLGTNSKNCGKIVKTEVLDNEGMNDEQKIVKHELEFISTEDNSIGSYNEFFDTIIHDIKSEPSRTAYESDMHFSFKQEISREAQNLVMSTQNPETL